MNDLGILYQLGNGVEKAPAKALMWYERAARRGLALASLNIAFLYVNGFGVPQDHVQAYAWAALAAERLADGDNKQQAQRVARALDTRFDPAQREQAATRLRELRLDVVPAASSSIAPAER
jgi:TPR repeat protein